MSDGDVFCGPIIKGLEGLANDVAAGRHGDPHVAFVVFVYPDQAPDIVGVSPATHQSLRYLVSSSAEDVERSRRKRGRFWSIEDLGDASHALSDALSAVSHDFRWEARKNSDLKLGDCVAEQIERLWNLRRDVKLQREMDAAAHRARYSAKCPHCGSGYTERGLKIHLARNRWCSRREAEAQSAGAA